MSKALIKQVVGKPSKLTKEVINRVINYYQTYSEYYDTPIETETQDEDGKTVTVTEMKSVFQGLPTLTHLADSIGVNRNTVYSWWRRDPEFAQMIKGLSSTLSKDICVNNGLKGNFNAAFAKSYMENEHRWNKESDEKDNKAPTLVFQVGINHFLSQQGVEPIKLDQKDSLTAFTEPEDID